MVNDEIGEMTDDWRQITGSSPFELRDVLKSVVPFDAWVIGPGATSEDVWLIAVRHGGGLVLVTRTNDGANLKTTYAPVSGLRAAVIDEWEPEARQWQPLQRVRSWTFTVVDTGAEVSLGTTGCLIADEWEWNPDEWQCRKLAEHVA